MPLFEYNCIYCKKNFELLRPIEERDQDCRCSHCQKTGKMTRLLSESITKKTSDSSTNIGSCRPVSSGFG